ncbi:MAG: hypothetical protein ACFFD4_31510 [Candidatus Odinarchaeota archaeon]
MIFFDLEFYVPPQDREKVWPSLKANPHSYGHFLLGGVFAEAIPYSSSIENYDIHQFWLWREGCSEEQLLKKIYDYLSSAWERADLENIPIKLSQKDLILAGINIANIDLPYLYNRMNKYQIATSEELFSVILPVKVIDLSQIGTLLFKNGNILYPPTTNGLKHRLQLTTPDKPSGSKVWDQFDTKDYQGIEQRTMQEVEDFILMYEQLLVKQKKISRFKKQ